MALHSNEFTPDFRWNPGLRHGSKMGNYIDKKGRPVSDKRVRSAIDDYLSAKTDTVRELAQKLQQGTIDTKTWQLAMENHIADIHVANMAAARGGRDRLTKADFLSAARAVKAELAGLKEWDDEPDPKKKKVKGGLRQFVEQIDAGLPLDGRFVARAMQYAQAGRHTYEVERKKKAIAAGMKQGRSVRHYNDSCSSCISQALAGWQLIEDIIPIGERKCKRYCKCTIEYRAIDPDDDVDDIVKRALDGEEISYSELRRLAAGIAESGFDERNQQRVKLKDGLVGLTYNGTIIQQGDRISTGTAHYLKHVVAQQEWPPGTTEEEYYGYIRKIIKDPKSGILISRKRGGIHVTFTNSSGDMQGPQGARRVKVEYRLRTHSWMTSYQVKDFKDIRLKRSQIKSLRNTPRAK